jgi:hypothetical protein
MIVSDWRATPVAQTRDPTPGKNYLGTPFVGAPTVPYLRNGFLRVPTAGLAASFRERRCNSTQPNTDIIALPFTVVRVVDAF